MDGIELKTLIRKLVREALELRLDKESDELIVVSTEEDPKKASQETFRNKNFLKEKGFKWNGDIKAWTMSAKDFTKAKSALSDLNKGLDVIEKLEDLKEFIRSSESFQGKNNLMDKINLYIDDLSNATDEKAMSAEIRRYLSFFARFRGHSFYNTMLIWLQRPDATRVAGFRQWEKKFHRRVKKGAKGIVIFVPIMYKKDDEQAGEDSSLDGQVEKKQSVLGFRPGYVFDISDTEPIDERGEVPSVPKWFTEAEPTERTKELYGYVLEVTDNMGITLTTDQTIGSEKGYSKGDHINMTSPVQGAGELATLIHELAHELMHWRKSSIYYQEKLSQDKLSKELMELQAESVSYVVMKHYDLSPQHQPTYLALWKANKQSILNNMKVISDVSKFIIEEVDKVAELSFKRRQASE